MFFVLSLNIYKLRKETTVKWRNVLLFSLNMFVALLQLADYYIYMMRLYRALGYDLKL